MPALGRLNQTAIRPSQFAASLTRFESGPKQGKAAVNGIVARNLMIRVALFGVIIGILVGSIVFVAGRLINLAETPNEAITTRFPEGWRSVPDGEYEKPLAWPSAHIVGLRLNGEGR